MPISVLPLADGTLFISCTNGDTLVYDPLFTASIPVRTSVRGGSNQNSHPTRVTGGIGGVSAYIAIGPSGKIRLEKSIGTPPGFDNPVEVANIAEIGSCLDDLKAGSMPVATFRWMGGTNPRLKELAQSVSGKGFVGVEIELPLDLLKDFKA